MVNIKSVHTQRSNLSTIYNAVNKNSFQPVRLNPLVKTLEDLSQKSCMYQMHSACSLDVAAAHSVQIPRLIAFKETKCCRSWPAPNNPPQGSLSCRRLRNKTHRESILLRSQLTIQPRSCLGWTSLLHLQCGIWRRPAQGSPVRCAAIRSHAERTSPPWTRLHIVPGTQTIEGFALALFLAVKWMTVLSSTTRTWVLDVVNPRSKGSNEQCTSKHKPLKAEKQCPLSHALNSTTLQGTPGDSDNPENTCVLHPVHTYRSTIYVTSHSV